MGDDGPMSELKDRECIPCKGGVPPLPPAEVEGLLAQLVGWAHTDHKRLSKAFESKDFVTALAFVNQIGELAERVWHHPDLTLAWGKVGVEIWTHKIDGLSESDFILAAKIDALPNSD